MLAGIVARLRSLWDGVRRRDRIEASMDDEFRLHLELRAQDLVRQGLTPERAARQARLEFGSTEQFKDEARESRGLRRIDQLRFSWLDMKLGFRMLVRYPGLTLVGGSAIAFAIWVGAVMFEFLAQVSHPAIPLPGGDRLVALRYWDARENRAFYQVLHDYPRWRQELRSVEDVGAFRQIPRNLILGDAGGEPIMVAEISASAFRLTRVPPLLGRTLIEDDERPAAPAVIVIGHDLWQSRFGSDPGIVGRRVRLGATEATIVGVMPDGYGFPVSHELWAPLRLDPLQYGPGEGPDLRVFGRLAPGVSLEEAQAELAVLRRSTAMGAPDVYEHLRPQVLPYAKGWVSIDGWQSLGVTGLNLFPLMLLGLIGANVALLLFARAAAREQEIGIRTALGASRGRIVTQLFAEALVLGMVAAVVGLAAAGAGLEWVYGTLVHEVVDRLPFWFQPTLSPSSVLYGLLLAAVAAILAGVIPALKVTRGVSTQLRQASAGGGGQRFGGLWTGVIVTQVAVTTIFPAFAFAVVAEREQIRRDSFGYPAQQYLSALLHIDREAAGAPRDASLALLRDRYATAATALERRLESDPAIAGVTWTGRLPGTYHDWAQIEIEGGAMAAPDSRGHRVSVAHVAPDFLEVLGARVLNGRTFNSGDAMPGASAVVVSERFVDEVLGGRNPIGRRLRYVAGESSRVPDEGKAGPWYEIVGVVGDLAARTLGTSSDYGRKAVYHAIEPGQAFPAYMLMQVRGDSRAVASRLRSIAAEVDPTIRLYDVMPADDVADSTFALLDFWLRLTLAASVLALVLSLAGIYAVMAFTVARRTREIGIRVALGAIRGRVIGAIFRRPLTHVGSGVLAGALVIALLQTLAASRLPSAVLLGATAGYAALMLAVCLLACLVPTRRALRVQPTEALRADA